MRLNSRRNSQISIFKKSNAYNTLHGKFPSSKIFFPRFKLKQISSPAVVHRIKTVDKLDTVNFARANKRWLLDNPPTIYIIARFQYLFRVKQWNVLDERVIKEFVERSRTWDFSKSFNPKRRSFGQVERNKFYARNLEFRKDATRFELDSATRVVNRETVKNWKTCWYTVRTELLFQYLKVSTRNKLATLVKAPEFQRHGF